MNAIITVGLGFGDEGKGASVDFLTREYHADLVVRYSGGAQAGHNVERKDRVRHTFSQFGAGTFAGARTYLGPRVIINPDSLLPEAEHLRECGIANPLEGLYIDSECLVSTAYHVLMNQLRELARGRSRHGSCGLGIGESRHYWLRFGEEAVFARDLHDPIQLRRKLTLLHERLLIEMQELDSTDHRLDEELAYELHALSPVAEVEQLHEATRELNVTRGCPNFGTAIFEGAQGILLDEWFGFHPYTTWSSVTPRHALELCHELNIDHPTIVGITRSLTTRHGAGPLPTFNEELTRDLIDPGNPENAWQGQIRAGYWDEELFDYATRVCPVDALVVTCLDQYPGMIATSYQGMTSLPTPRSLREQGELAKRLDEIEPTLEALSRDDFLDRLERFAPVRVTAAGACDYRWHGESGLPGLEIPIGVDSIGSKEAPTTYGEYRDHHHQPDLSG